MFNSLKELTLEEYQVYFKNDYRICYFKALSKGLINIIGLSNKDTLNLKNKLIDNCSFLSLDEIDELDNTKNYFLDDYVFALDILKNNPYCFSLLPKRLKENESFILEYLYKLPKNKNAYIDKSIKYDYTFLKSITFKHKELIYLLDPKDISKSDFEYFIKKRNIIYDNYPIFNIRFDLDWLKDIDFFYSLIMCGYQINYSKVSNSLIYDQTLLKQLIKSVGYEAFSSNGLINFFNNIKNPKFLKKIIRKNPYIFAFISNDNIRNNLGFVKAIFKMEKRRGQLDCNTYYTFRDLYSNLSNELKNNVELAKFFISLNLSNFSDINIDLQENHEIIEFTSKKYGAYRVFGGFVYNRPENKASIKMVKECFYAYAPLNRKILNEYIDLDDDVLLKFYEANPKLILFETIQKVLTEKDFQKNIMDYPENIIYFLDTEYQNHSKIFNVSKYIYNKNFIINAFSKNNNLTNYISLNYLSVEIICECLKKNSNSFKWLGSYIKSLTFDDIFIVYLETENDNILNFLIENDIDYFEDLIIIGKISLNKIKTPSIRKKIVKIFISLKEKDLI